MFEQVTTPRANPVILPADLASFARFDLPEQYTSTSPLVLNPDYTLLQTFIEAASDQIEQMAATAMITEGLLLTFDFFPGQQDPRQALNYELGFFKDALVVVRLPNERLN